MRIVDGGSPVPTFWSFVMGHDNYAQWSSEGINWLEDTVCLWLIRHKDGSIVRISMPTSGAGWPKIQSMATRNNDGARIHPCVTPDVVEKRRENLLPILTGAPVWVRMSSVRCAFWCIKLSREHLFLSTESKADLIPTNGGVSDSVSVTDVLENYGNHSRFRVVERRTSSWMVKMVAADKEGAADKQCLGEGRLRFKIQRRAASAPKYLALERMMLTFSTVVQDVSIWSQCWYPWIRSALLRFPSAQAK